MNHLLLAIVLLPLLGFVVNGVLGTRFGGKLFGEGPVNVIACALPAASFALTVFAFSTLLTTNTPLIDLEARSLDLVSRAGEAGSKKYYLHYTPADKVAAFPNGIADDTHISELGARAMANLVAQELKGLKVPVAEKVLADRPDFTREKPLGSFACH